MEFTIVSISVAILLVTYFYKFCSLVKEVDITNATDEELEDIFRQVNE